MRLRAALFLLWQLSWLPAGWAEGLQVTPTLLEIPAGDAVQSQTLWLSNTSASAIRVQIRALAWTQNEGVETLTPTRDLALSPPLVELPAGARKLVRIVRKDTGPVTAELAYRLVVDELPPGDAAQAAGQPPPGLSFLLRYLVPLFVLPLDAASGDAPTPIQTRWVRDPDGTAWLQVRNRGSRRVQMARLSATDAAGRKTVLVPGLLGYALAGQTMRWKIPATDRVASPPRGLAAMVDGGSLDRPLPIDDVGP